MNDSDSTTAGRGAFSELQEALSGLFENIVGPGPGFGFERRSPRYELRVEDDGYRVFADLPGMRREDIDVSVSGRTLSISGEWREPDLPDGAEVLRRERARGRFARAVQLPDEIDPLSVTARFKDGVLEVRLAKPSATRGRSIKVEAVEEEVDENGEKGKKGRAKRKREEMKQSGDEPSNH